MNKENSSSSKNYNEAWDFFIPSCLIGIVASLIFLYNLDSFERPFLIDLSETFLHCFIGIAAVIILSLLISNQEWLISSSFFGIFPSLGFVVVNYIFFPYEKTGKLSTYPLYYFTLFAIFIFILCCIVLLKQLKKYDCKAKKILIPITLFFMLTGGVMYLFKLLHVLRR